MALLKLSRNDISKWLESQRIVKPLQDMTESEIQKAVETFRIPRQALLQIINATEYDTALTPVGGPAVAVQLNPPSSLRKMMAPS